MLLKASYLPGLLVTERRVLDKAFDQSQLHGRLHLPSHKFLVPSTTKKQSINWTDSISQSNHIISSKTWPIIADSEKWKIHVIYIYAESVSDTTRIGCIIIDKTNRLNWKCVCNYRIGCILINKLHWSWHQPVNHCSGLTLSSCIDSSTFFNHSSRSWILKQFIDKSIIPITQLNINLIITP